MENLELCNNVYIISTEILLSDKEFSDFKKAKKIQSLILDDSVSNATIVNVLLTRGLRNFLKEYEEYGI